MSDTEPFQKVFIPYRYYYGISDTVRQKDYYCLTNGRHKAAKCQIRVIEMMDRITIRLPRQQVEMLEKLVEAGEFPTVSEAVRYSVRALLERHGNRVLREADQISFQV